MYSSTYRDLVEGTSTDAFLEIVCKTSVSPPTKVMWMCDGELVNINGIDFEQYQIVRDRRNIYYDNILLVKNTTYAAGRHNYTCIIKNSQGNSATAITTNIPGM